MIAWIKQKENISPDPRNEWFAKEGNWKTPKNVHSLVSTLSTENESTQGWTLFYRETDRTLFGHRFWFTEFGAKQVDQSSFAVSVRISHALNREYIGLEPPAPKPSAPRFVKDIFSQSKLKIMSGNLALSSQPIEIRLGQANVVEDSVFATKRECPVVFINGGFHPTTFPISPIELQKHLIGKAQVLWCGDEPELGEELSLMLPKAYMCRYRSVRVYLPHVRREFTEDAQRHRFFSRSEIAELGGKRVEEAITTALARGHSNREENSFLTHDDIRAHARVQHLAQFRAKDKPTKEWIQALEVENSKLESEKKEANQLLTQADQEISALQSHCLKYEAQIQSLSAMRLSVNSRNQSDVNMMAYRKVTSDQADDATPSDCLKGMLFLYPDRVRILPSAFAAADESAEFRNTTALWDLLFLLGGDYYQAISSEDGGGDERARSVFGNQYSAQESESVATSARLRRARTFNDEGTTRTMFRHLKLGVKDSVSETIRVHFDWDHSTQRIVIGYCGPHLPLN